MSVLQADMSGLNADQYTITSVAKDVINIEELMSERGFPYATHHNAVKYTL